MTCRRMGRTVLTSTLVAVAIGASSLAVGPGAATAAGPPPITTDGATVGTTDGATVATKDGATVAAIERPDEPVPGQYIVTLRDPAADASAPAAAQADAAVQTQASSLADEYDGTVIDTYSAALAGFSVRMDDGDAVALSRDPAVASVVQDGYVHADATVTPGSWGLDRIDQRGLPLDRSYTYQSDGSVTTVYVIDSGIRTTHVDFEGRASVGVDYVGDGIDGQDCNGHGTHVASTIGGREYGVAKNVALVSVRTLNCQGTGTWSNIIAGIDWVTANHQSPAVANMSLGGTGNTAVDRAVVNSIASGVSYVVAAGNGNADACGSSPARAAGTITVAATSSADSRATFSNYGRCVDLFAPGVDIRGASRNSNTASTLLSGTSMAAPHVAGLAAMYRNANPLATPAQVRSAIVDNATTARVVDPGPGSPNRLAFVGFVGAPPTGRITPVTRIFGQDAIDTSLAISQAMFGDDGAAAVVLARSDHFADALAGGPLAAAEEGPLLITPGSAINADLDGRVLDEIRRVLPAGRTVYVLGGRLALSPAVDTSLEALGYTVERVEGPNQFATAVAIANRLGNPSVVFEATGLSFADALSAVPAAIGSRGAILLTNGNEQAPETAAYLLAHPPLTRYAIGGPLAAAGADPLAIPVYGADLFATSAAVANRFFRNSSTVGAATGLDFPDALSGGVFMGSPRHPGPVLLLMPTPPIPTSVAGYLTRTTTTAQGFLFGGPLAVDDDVMLAVGRL